MPRNVLLAAQVMVSAALIGYLASRLGRDELSSLASRLSAGRVIFGTFLLVLLVAGGIAGAALRLRGVGQRANLAIPLRVAVRVNCLSILAALVTPLGVAGDALRVVLLTRPPVDADVGAGVRVAVADRLVGLATSVTTAGLGLVALGAVRRSTLTDSLYILSVVIVGGLTLVLVVALARAGRATGAREPSWADVTVGAFRDPSVLLGSLASQACEVAFALVLVRMLGFSEPPLGIVAAVSSYLPLLEALPASFLGIGAREGVLEFALLQYGAPVGSGLMLGITGLTVRLLALVVAVSWAGIYKANGRSRIKLEPTQ